MAKAAKKQLAVDGTAKLAAKAKPSDEHNKTSLNIEEATVASPRASRKRAGEFNDFENDELEAKAAGKDGATKTAKSNKKAKTSKADDTSKAGKATKAKVDKSASKSADAIATEVKKETKKPAAEKKAKAPKKEATAEPSTSKADVNGGPAKATKKKAESSKAAESKAKPAAAEKKEKAKADKPKAMKKESADSKPSKAEPASKAKKSANSKNASSTPAKATKAKKETGEKKAAPKQKDVVKKTPAAAATSGTAATKSKKRKAAPVDAEVKNGVLDPLSEHQAKKQKKESRKSISESFGDMVNTGYEAAVQGANSLRQSFGGFLGGNSKKIADSGPEVASIPFDRAAETAKRAASKAKSASKKAAGKVPASGVSVRNTAAVTGDDESGPEPEESAELLKGFESSSDDEPAEADRPYKGPKIPPLPSDKKLKKQLKSEVRPEMNTGNGVVYLGRIPHGFYENQIRGYCEQFGPVSRLRLSRSRKTGNSRHFAFVEFENEDTARIFAATMDNYLMFGHLLKCKLVPKESLHENIWKGADRSFKAVPWNQIVGRALAEPSRVSEWIERQQREEAKRAKKLEQTKHISYEFVPPQIKSAAEALEARQKATISAKDADPESVAKEKAAGSDKKAKKAIVAAAKATETVTKQPSSEGKGVTAKTKKASKSKA